MPITKSQHLRPAQSVPAKNYIIGLIISVSVLLLVAVGFQILIAESKTPENQTKTSQTSNLWLGSLGIIGSGLLILLCVVLFYNAAIMKEWAPRILQTIEQRGQKIAENIERVINVFSPPSGRT